MIIKAERSCLHSDNKIDAFPNTSFFADTSCGFHVFPWLLIKLGALGSLNALYSAVFKLFIKLFLFQNAAFLARHISLY